MNIKVLVWFQVLCLGMASTGVTEPFQVLEIRQNTVLETNKQMPARLIIRWSHLTVDGNNATLVGPGTIGDAKSLENAGIGILIENQRDVVIKNLRVRGFANGLVIRKCENVTIINCDFSDNYHNPQHGWGELPPRGGILCEKGWGCVFRHNRANRVWDGIHLVDSDQTLVEDNDFSDCSNTGAKLWHSSENKFLRNNLSYGLRLDRKAGEVHARDSCGVLIETGSDKNYFFRNNITHGGDGIFIRPLNRWVSRWNVFEENDTSYANNNCVESWSPCNTFIRNKANYGSYGFWLGGSDGTTLIGNEAAYNGLTNGNHNAPEPGFGHGGIVFVGGSSSHITIQSNYLHHNNGAGIAFRGDVASQGRAWQAEHWLIQQNKIMENRFGIWGRWGKQFVLAANEFTQNQRGNYITNVSDWIELPGKANPAPLPAVGIFAPDTQPVGEPARIATSPRNEPGLNYRWWIEDKTFNEALFHYTFGKPGFYRVNLVIDNGAQANASWRDVIVVQPVAQELGTEGQAQQWGYELELNDNGQGKIYFDNESGGVIGTKCLRFTPKPYPGAYATAVFPVTRDAGWNFSKASQIRFWIKTRNPNLSGFQNAGPVVRLLHRSGGQMEFKPAKDANLLNDPPFSEARWEWMPIQIPLRDAAKLWQRKVTGQFTLEQVDAITLSFDSWGSDPFTVWLDGLTVD